MKQSYCITFPDEFQAFKCDCLGLVFVAFEGFYDLIEEIFFWIFSGEERSEERAQFASDNRIRKSE